MNLPLSLLVETIPISARLHLLQNATTNTITYTVDTSRILSGVGLALTANVMDNKEIIMNLVPVTSKLQEPIEYKDFGISSSGNAAHQLVFLLSISGK